MTETDALAAALREAFRDDQHLAGDAFVRRLGTRLDSVVRRRHRQGYLLVASIVPVFATAIVLLGDAAPEPVALDLASTLSALLLSGLSAMVLVLANGGSLPLRR